jgi:small GTP-binding protein
MIQVKIIFWGPGDSGKTTTFLAIQQIFQKYVISNPIMIATTDKRTIWNDSVCLQFPFRNGLIPILVNISTTSGQERFLTTREYVLQNADGVIFVADSAPEKMTENVRSFQELITFTSRASIPIVFQLNKRDLPNAVPLARFLREMELPLTDPNSKFQLVHETIATSAAHLIRIKKLFLTVLIKLTTTYV